MKPLNKVLVAFAIVGFIVDVLNMYVFIASKIG